MAGYVEMYRLGKTYDTPNGPAVIVEKFNQINQQLIQFAT